MTEKKRVEENMLDSLDISPLDQPFIPRKVLQRELSNEKIYEKPQPLTSHKKDKVIDPVIGQSTLRQNGGLPEEIIPRLHNFPMQGKTIRVAGHDDSLIFSGSKKKMR